MFVLGIILIILGFILPLPILYTIGVILVIVGLILWFVPLGGHTRRWY